jgi:hypothetical protein
MDQANFRSEPRVRRLALPICEPTESIQSTENGGQRRLYPHVAVVECLTALIATHDSLHDLAAIEVTKWSDKSLIGGVPLVSPATESHQYVEKILALLRQDVLVTGRSLLVEAGDEDFSLNQPREAVGENVAGDSEVLLKIVKSLDPQEGIAKDENRPLITNQLSRIGDGTLQIFEALPCWHSAQSTG